MYGLKEYIKTIIRFILHKNGFDDYFRCIKKMDLMMKNWSIYKIHIKQVVYKSIKYPAD